MFKWFVMAVVVIGSVAVYADDADACRWLRRRRASRNCYSGSCYTSYSYYSRTPAQKAVQKSQGTPLQKLPAQK